MKITLVATYTHPVALGLRLVSSYLKAAGHDVEMIFMKSKRDTAKADFTDAALDDFVEHLRDRDLIGMGLMTNTFFRASVLTKHIRDADLKAPIVWGGTHPTVAPEESMAVPDAICIGEGEEPLLRFVECLEQDRDPTGVGSFGFRADGPFKNKTTIRNPVLPLERNLDDYPFADYELDTHWVAEPDGLSPAAPHNLRGSLHRLRVETTRGCPYPCAFCNNAALLEVYRGKGSWVRKRSNDNVLAEILKARACFPTIEAVNIVDDLFFVRSEADIEDFAIKYAEKVRLPLELDAFPNTISQAKVQSLSRVPINLISMGIQSGSADTLKRIYQRPTPIKTIIEGIDLFAKYKLRAEYHYLVNNPFESDENRIETLRFAATHHRGPAILRIFPLQFYPGTPLYQQARDAGLIGERHESAYQYTYTGKTHLFSSQYLDLWLRVVLNLKNRGVPAWPLHRLIGLVTHRLTRKVLDRPWFLPVAAGCYRVGRFIGRKVIYQVFVRPFSRLRRRPRYDERHPEDEVTLPRRAVARTAPWTLSEADGPALAFRDRPSRPGSGVGSDLMPDPVSLDSREGRQTR